MTPIDTLKKIFRDAGIDSRCLYIGNGARIGKRIHCKAPRYYKDKNKEKDVEYRQFVVKYFRQENLFVVWDAKISNPTKRIDYTLNINDLPDNIVSEKFTIAKKRIKIRGGPIEPVAVFTPEGIEQFFDYYKITVSER